MDRFWTLKFQNPTKTVKSIGNIFKTLITFESSISRTQWRDSNRSEILVKSWSVLNYQFLEPNEESQTDRKYFYKVDHFWTIKFQNPMKSQINRKYFWKFDHLWTTNFQNPIKKVKSIKTTFKPFLSKIQ